MTKSLFQNACAAVVIGAFLPIPAFGQDAKPATPAPVPTPAPTPNPPVVVPVPGPDTPIVPDAEFDAALPPLSGDINAPLEPLPASPADVAGPGFTPEVLPEAAPAAPEFAEPLPPLATFETTPPVDVADTGGATTKIRYDTVVNGLDVLGLTSRFKALSALREGDGEAANAEVVAARGREDELLAVRLMKSLGYFDATATSVVETIPNDAGRIRAVVTATPGSRFTLAKITVDAGPVVPTDLITKNLPLAVGDPIEADRIQGAEANVQLILPQNGYPFAKVGPRDILLDDEAFTGDYTLPVATGPRSSFGTYSTTGKLAFDAEHVGVLARFKPGELYDSRKVDDLRKALVATGLFATVAVEPVRTGQPGPDRNCYG